jgi:uncharacterized protein YjbJ (UPF0337 family)
MTGLRTKGTVNKVTGRVEEGLGKLTGNRAQQSTGKTKQYKGAAQQGVANLQDAAKPR